MGRSGARKRRTGHVRGSTSSQDNDTDRGASKVASIPSTTYNQNTLFAVLTVGVVIGVLTTCVIVWFRGGGGETANTEQVYDGNNNNKDDIESSDKQHKSFRRGWRYNTFNNPCIEKFIRVRPID